MIVLVAAAVTLNIGWIYVNGRQVLPLVFGVLAQFVGEANTGYEWLVDAVGFAFGAVAASEIVVAWQATGPVSDGLALVPALAGGIVVGLIVELATRLITGGTYRSNDRPLSI